jgi:hypothetical protein
VTTPRNNGRHLRIRLAPPGETRISSCDRFPNAIQRFLTWNCFNQASSDVITARARFSNPKLPHIAVLQGVKAFYKAIGKQSPRLARERKRFLGNLFNCEAHFQGSLMLGNIPW